MAAAAERQEVEAQAVELVSASESYTRPAGTASGVATLGHSQ